MGTKQNNDISADIPLGEAPAQIKWKFQCNYGFHSVKEGSSCVKAVVANSCIVVL